MTTEEKRAFANEIERRCTHPIVRETVKVAQFNLRITPGSLEATALEAIAQAAAQVAVLIDRGIDPAVMIRSADERHAAMERLAVRFAQAGTPVVVVEAP